jgi:RNA 2',3'-cyclic 3'-phosphodiesterase
MNVAPPRRLFLGLLPPRDVQLQVHRHAATWDWPRGARPMRFGRYHLTLHFLGDVALAPERRLRAALRAVAMEPLDLVLEQPAVWRQGVAVLQPGEHPGLRALRRRVVDCVRHAGLPAVGAFTPHVTLARDAFGAVPPRAVAGIHWPVRGYVLVWSRLDTKPAQYAVVEEFGVVEGAVLRLEGQGVGVQGVGVQGDLF